MKALIILLLLFAGCVQQTQVSKETVAEYDPKISPDDFVSGITNKYLKLTPGKKFVYEARIEEGIERTEVLVTNQTKTVALGVTAVVVWDRVFLNGELIEDTKDWYAQDKEGNVWYLGEDTVELAGGKIVSHAGAWEAGVDGGKPGIIMKAEPKVVDSYRQEYYKGVAEDFADVVALGESVTTPYGSFTGCLKTREYTPLEPSVEAFKFYCPEVGFLVLELEDGERVELIEVTTEAQKEIKETPREELQTNITEEKAKEIALREVPGVVTNVAIEVKFGKPTYVVEIVDMNDVETDVIIDINTGEVLGIER